MGGDDDDNEKSHQPSQKKLDDARVKGDVPRSADLTTASTYGGLLIAFLALGTTSLSNTFSIFSYMLDKSDVLALVWFSESSRQIIRSMTSQLILALSIWFFVPMCAALISIIIQRSFIIAPDKILLKFSRISIISNGKNKFGRSGLFDFLKSTLKLSLYSLILGVLLYARLPEIISTIQMPPISVLYVFLKISIEFLTIVFIIAIFIGCLDFLWQYNEHIRQNRMSYKEMLDEHKQMEGDPHVKQQRRQRGYDIAMNQMLKDIPNSDVILVNPKHYAVALKWSRSAGEAPICTAKGVDEIAARIREVASEAGVPIHSDPPTARALYASIEVGDQIRPDHYRAVASAIRFAEAMRAKIKERKS